MHHVGSLRLFCAIVALLPIFTYVSAYPSAALAQANVESQIQQLPEPKVHIQKINPSAQMFQDLTTIGLPNSSASLSTNHALTAIEHYQVRVAGSQTLLNIEHYTTVLLDRFERAVVLLQARSHLRNQRSVYGDRPLLPEDDPYAITSTPNGDVVFQLRSAAPYKPTYGTANNVITGLAKFFRDRTKTGAVRCFVVDETISRKDDGTPVAYAMMWTGHT